MDESNKFEGIPEDVKREMLMLFETYSKKELINKLRSLREPSSTSPEKTVTQTGAVAESINTEDCHSNLNLSEIVDSNGIDTLASANDHNQTSKTNASFQNEVNQGKRSKTGQHHSLITSFAESDALKCELIKNNISFNPVVLIQKLDLTKIHYTTSLSDIPNPIIEDAVHKIANASVPSTNIRTSKNKKVMLTNDTLNVSLKDFEPSENCPRTVKGRNHSPKTNAQSKSQPNSQRHKKFKQSPAEQEIIQKVSPNSDELQIKSPIRTKSGFLKTLNPNNKGRPTDDPFLKLQTNVNAFINEPKDVSNENKNNSIKSTELKIKSPIVKRNLKMLKSHNNLTDSNAFPNLKVANLSSPKVKKSPQKLLRKNTQTSDSKTSKSTISRRKSVQKEHCTSYVDTEKHSVITDGNIVEVVSENSLVTHINVPKPAVFCENAVTSIESNPVTKLASLRKQGYKIKSSDETVLSSKKTSSCSNTDTNAQHLTNKDVNVNQSFNTKNLSNNSVEAKSVTSNADAEKHSAITDDNINEEVSKNSSVAHINAPNSGESLENAPTTIESHQSRIKSSQVNRVTKPSSSEKQGYRIKSSDKAVSSLKPKVLEKTSSCSNTDINTHHLTIKDVNINQSLSKKCSCNNSVIAKSTEKKLNSTKMRSDDRILVPKSMSLRKLSNIILSNSETASILEQKILEKGTSNTNNKNQCQNNESPSSNKSIPNVDANLTSRLRKKRKASGSDEVKGCANLDERQHNADAYLKLSKMCSLQGLNLDDIFSRKEVKEMIEKYQNNPEAIVFFGTSQCSSTGKIEPIIHVHKCKKILLETLAMIQNKDSVTLKTCK